MQTLEAIAPHLSRRGDGEFITSPGEVAEIHLTGAQTGGPWVLEITADPQVGPPPHIHHHEDEIFFVHEGTFEFLVNGATHIAGPGTVVFGPRGIPHTFKNVGEAPGKLLLVVNSDNFVEFYRQWPGCFENGVPNMPKAIALLTQHGIELVG